MKLKMLRSSIFQRSEGAGRVILYNEFNHPHPGPPPSRGREVCFCCLGNMPLRACPNLFLVG